MRRLVTLCCRRSNCHTVAFPICSSVCTTKAPTVSGDVGDCFVGTALPVLVSRALIHTYRSGGVATEVHLSFIMHMIARSVGRIMDVGI
jgi:hypothetical protein